MKKQEQQNILLKPTKVDNSKNVFQIVFEKWSSGSYQCRIGHSPSKQLHSFSC